VPLANESYWTTVSLFGPCCSSDSGHPAQPRRWCSALPTTPHVAFGTLRQALECFHFQIWAIFRLLFCKASVRGANRNTNRIGNEAPNAMPGVHTWPSSREKQLVHFRNSITSCTARTRRSVLNIQNHGPCTLDALCDLPSTLTKK
jgi:hypothetical protein